jgi:hypothetical protein
MQVDSRSPMGSWMSRLLLGGLLLLDPSGQVSYLWRDQGICHVANFEELLKKLPKKKL